jgi:hypothetical protein
MQADGTIFDETALSIHPYPEYDDPTVDHFVRSFNQLQTRLGSTSPVRIVVTEVGADVHSSSTNPWPFVWDLHGQCTKLTTEYSQLDGADPAIPLSDHVDGVIFHTDVEPPPVNGTPQGDGYAFGLISANGSPATSYTYTARPVYSEFQRVQGVGAVGAPPDPQLCGSSLGVSATYGAATGAPQ